MVKKSGYSSLADMQKPAPASTAAKRQGAKNKGAKK
jgi:hypothetical protein